MSNENTLQNLKEIKSVMSRTSIKISRKSGWFFLIWGVIWLIGFGVTQFAADLSRYVWIGLNVIGIASNIILVRKFYGKTGPHALGGMGIKMALVSIGIVAFDVLLVILFQINAPDQIVVLIVLSTALCYFFVGIFTHWNGMLSGALLAATLVIAKLFFPDIMYLLIAVFGGGVFVLCGTLIMAQKE
ncbi:MAG: hypothetical protein JW969_02195 [Spirochaetales bacterium]|nr:hypothetical protein [Spirochaetales bacterium]